MQTEQQNIDNTAEAQILQTAGSTEAEQARSGHCPIDHRFLSRQKTAQHDEPVDRPIECDAQGVWHVRGFSEARTLLRTGDTKQAGFNAEQIEQFSSRMKAPILYQEGKPHHQQRKQTARFFTPKVVQSNYSEITERFADQLVSEFQQKKHGNVNRMAVLLAARVAGEVIGLKNSPLKSMVRRIEAFFEQPDAEQQRSRNPLRWLTSLRNNFALSLFFFLDVRPAINARHRAPKEDIISYLLSQKYNDAEILTECVTYAAAGITTTREFISIAAWHMLEQPVLRERFINASEEERYAILHELLRVEPVIGHIYRRTNSALTLESRGKEIAIPAGALIDIHVYGANADESIVGAYPQMVCPGRPLTDERAYHEMMSFGDGHHRCPGFYVAIQETDIFLRRFFALGNIHIEQAPTVKWNSTTSGYELRDFSVRLD